MSKLDTTPLPEGSFEWEFVKDLSEQEAHYIAEWMAKAFDKTDCYAFVLTGVKYDEDPRPHYLFFRAMLDRGSVTGSIITNKTRTAVRTILRPGEPDNRMDLDWTSPKDENWKKFLDYCGGKDAFRRRNQVFFEQEDKVYESLYGEDQGLSLWRSSFLAVHQEHQGRGLGKAMHNVIAAEVQKNNDKLGCKSLPYSIAYPVPEKDKSYFKPENEGFTFVEYVP